MGTRANTLAERIERGARELEQFVSSLSDAEWKAMVAPDGRSVGVIVHHVASMYPIEIELAQKLAAGQPISGVTWGVVGGINLSHSQEHASTTKLEALALLRKNSQAAAEAVRKFSDEELDRANSVSLNGDAPLTTQFFVEGHALSHSFHHLAKIREALKK